MAQIFPAWLNRIPLFVGLTLPLLLGSAVAAVDYWFSPKFTDVGYMPDQPVGFSHKLHAGDLGLDCRYCHNTVERARHAAVPPTATCMNCHANVLSDSPKLERVRRSIKTGESIPWLRVHLLPDYAYFDHAAHLAAGVGCASCHGRIDHMRVVRQQAPLSMGWCLDCHRHPGPHIRPAGIAPTQMNWVSADGANQTTTATGRPVKPPVHCSGCHR